MPTKLQSPLKRELLIGGKPYVLTISTDGFKLTEKGKRKGRELAWKDLVSGEAALAVALKHLRRFGLRAARRRRRECHPNIFGGQDCR